MRSVSVALRRRRRGRLVRSHAGGGRSARNLALIAVAGVTVLLGVGFGSVGEAYLQAAANLPEVSHLAEWMGSAGEETHRPARLFDRSGQVLLFELSHPLAADRRWLSLESIPESVRLATVAALDPTFWSNPGYAPGALTVGWLAVLGGSNPEDLSPTLTQRLVEQTLMTAAEGRTPEGARAFRSALLAGKAARAYSKPQILEWFLNTADFGNLAFGVDAASLVYFGKHADGLTLAEAALLASVPAHPEANPLDDPQAAQANQQRVLTALRVLGWVTEEQADAAARGTIAVRLESQSALEGLGFVAYAWNELRSTIGSGAALQGSLTVITTLDTDLQLQTDCVLRTQMARLAGAGPTSVEAADDGSACLAAGLLPLPRPGDVGREGGIGEVSAVVIDAATGEVLAVSGRAEEARSVGSMLAPFVYLTAFSKGYTPATMVVDAPEGAFDAEGDFHGPVRMRTALANGYAAAARRTLDLAGASTVARTAGQMGLRGIDPFDEGDLAGLAAGDVQVSLVDLAFAFAPIAHRGIAVGVPDARGEEGVTPYLVRSVIGPDGRVLYSAESQSRPVLSPSLAYLLEHILSDEAARWPTYGQGSALEIGRPAAVFAGLAPDARDGWTVGFTPARIVGVRVGGEGGRPMEGIQTLNGAAPIWHALMRYAVRNLPPEGWPAPADVSSVEVCDPSGYLPTPFCPNVVREVFLAGTEPTHPDHLYQPYLINRETGKLATLFTPPELVDERVYFVPPPEAEAWARREGIEPPPTEYDTYIAPAVDSDVRITEPEPFDLLRGVVALRGAARGEDFDVYRIRYGQGLNPTGWIQIGDDGRRPLDLGVLARWDTTGLDGLYTLQLMVVRGDGTVETVHVPVTVDNEPPQARLVLPEPGARFTWPEAQIVLIQAEVRDGDGVARIDFYVDGARAGTAEADPWSMRWPVGPAGDHVVTIRVTDRAGNVAESEPVSIYVER